MADLKISQLSVATVAPALSYIPIAASGANWAIPATAAAIGAQPADATLTAVAGVTTAANKVVYFTGTDTAAATDLTSFGRTFLSSSSASPARTYLELSSSDNVVFNTVRIVPASNSTSLVCSPIYTISADSANYLFGFQFEQRSVVNTGITESGLHSAGLITSFRNNIAAGTDDSGTNLDARCLSVQFGHKNTNSGATPQTTKASGIYIIPWGQTGTITNLYAIYITGVQPGGTVTNNWAIYQDSATAKNYLGGNTGIGTNAPTGKLDVNDNVIRVRTAKTPASAAAAGNQGDIAWDSNYIYVCTATNTWKRVAISTW